MDNTEETIADRLKRLRKDAGLTQAELAKAVGVSTSTVGNIESGIRGYGANIIFFAKALGTTPYFLQAVGRATRAPPVEMAQDAIYIDNNPDFPAVRRVNIKAQAGVTGYAIEHIEEDGPSIVFRKDWYTAHGYIPEKMLAMRVSGESMTPSLYDSDLIVMNTAQSMPKDGIVFVATYEGEVVVKRLLRDQGQWWLTSDNPDQRRYPRKVCDSHTQIIGEVVYRQTERI